jgi:hypothetical protein
MRLVIGSDHAGGLPPTSPAATWARASAAEDEDCRPCVEKLHQMDAES